MNEILIRKAFEERIPILKKLGQYVAETITTTLRIKFNDPEQLRKVLQIPVEPRVKDADSFIEKAFVRKFKADPLNEITDQVGVRFVVLLIEQIAIVSDIIEQEPSWKATKDRDFEEEKYDDPNYFDYQSVHYVIHLKKDLDRDGIIITPALPCEIQIRTILQHAYAEMAHSCSYKPKMKLPKADECVVLRALAKGSALIETTDDVFKEINNKFNTHNKKIEELMHCARKLYEESTKSAPMVNSKASNNIIITYRDKLNDLSPEELELWFNQSKQVQIAITTCRERSPLFRDAVIVILAWLIDKYKIETVEYWPFDATILENIYCALGESTRGSF